MTDEMTEGGVFLLGGGLSGWVIRCGQGIGRWGSTDFGSGRGFGVGDVTGFVRGADRNVRVIRRDELMLEWFSIVRVANVQTVRWVLGALNGWTTPVSSRQAQSWCSRMRTAGLIEWRNWVVVAGRRCGDLRRGGAVET